MASIELSISSLGCDFRQLLEMAQVAASSSDAAFQKSAFVRQLQRAERDGRLEADLHRKILRSLIESRESLIDSLRYPSAVLSLVHLEFDRIKKLISCGKDESLRVREHSLRCDYRIVCFARVPVGSQHIELTSVPRSLMVRGGIRQCATFLRMLRKTGGLGPFYQTHMSHDVNRFNFLVKSSERARTEMYQSVAACLEMNPSVRGAIGSSWLYDPQLEIVSPHLAFYRKTPVENGAFLLRYGHTSGAATKALSHSQTRRELYEAGKYKPASYVIVWPRNSLISWAEKAAE